jgi:hypothetical protein
MSSNCGMRYVRSEDPGRLEELVNGAQPTPDEVIGSDYGPPEAQRCWSCDYGRAEGRLGLCKVCRKKEGL